LTITLDRNPEPSAGATGWAAGSQMCSGHDTGLEPETRHRQQERRGSPAGRDRVCPPRDLRQIKRSGVRREDHERGDDQYEPGFAERQEQERAPGYALALVVTQDQQVTEQRHRLPGDQEGDDVSRGQQRERREQREVVDEQVDGGPGPGLVVTRRVQRDRNRDEAEQHDERGRQRLGVKARGADEV
jgi:hypothetical protein